ncbi:MAG: DMT family transporter [Pseudomonadota bacterium]
MIAFAGNSILCRMALYDGALDAATYTVVRLLSAALTLVGILLLRERHDLEPARHGSWRSAITLAIYAICFSYAYISLGAATGALLLFGFAQLTMIVAALLAGERPLAGEALGWLLAAAGLCALLLPGAASPSLLGSAMMAVAGVGWGLYTLYGRGETRPLASTTGNFVRVLLPTAGFAILAAFNLQVSTTGLLLAVASGSLTTGVGYVIWYAALPSLSALQAALIQLSVPAIAAFGGVLLLGETLTARLAVCGALILGGIALSLGSKYRRHRAI